MASLPSAAAVGKVLGAVMAVVVVSGGAAGALVAAGVVDVAPPSVESVETEWGEVSDEQTEIATTVTVQNPNPVGVPSVASIEYDVSMNGVQMAEGSKDGIGLSTGSNQINLTAGLENDKVVDWWVAHVNDGEKSTMRVTGTVSAPGGVERNVEQTRPIETNMITALSDSSGETTVGFAGEPVLTVHDRSTSWGEATTEKTPVTFTAKVTNEHDRPVTLDGVTYNVTMNGVVMGDGADSERIEVAPGETVEVTINAAIESERMADWWEQHIRSGEQSNVSVQVYGYIEENGERQRVPIAVVDRRIRLTTDLLGENQTRITPLETQNDRTVTKPSVERVTRQWDGATDAETRVETSVVVNNQNDAVVSRLVDLSIGQQVMINGVDVVQGQERSTYGLQPGTNVLNHTVALDNDRVPEWWSKHINNGERSKLTVAPQVTADIGVTAFEVSPEASAQTVETDILSGVGSDGEREITARGRTVGVVSDRTATWGTATTEETPVKVTLTVENDSPLPMTVSDATYSAQLNEVGVGNGTAPEEYTIAPGETRTITFTFVIDSQRMDEWWVSHIRNGERTEVDFDATATVTVGDQSKQVEMTDEGTNTVIETSFLGSEE